MPWWWLPSYTAFIAGLFIFNMMPGFLLGLKNVDINVPRFVPIGKDIRLTCNFDLEGLGLYAVKWYKGLPFKEFYRFVPKEAPQKIAFHLNVNVSLSNSREVVLKNVTPEIHNGVYKCSVAAEFPFETLEDESPLTVVVIGDEAPVLRLDREQYHIGDPVTAECQSPASFPSANISWYINDVKMEHGRIRKTEVRGRDATSSLIQSKMSVSTVSFDLPEKVAPTRLFCRATVLSVYDQKSNITTIQPIPRRLSGTETLLHSGSSRASSEIWNIFLLLGLEIMFGLVALASFNSQKPCLKLKSSN